MKIAILGASGRTGRLLVEQSLAASHTVRALVRDPKKLPIDHPQLEIVRGDATDAAAVRQLVEGCDVVLSALGPTGSATELCSAAARHLIAAKVRRYVSVSGAGLDVPGDAKDFIGKVVSFIVRTVSPGIFADKVLEHSLLAASDLAWTLVRPPQLLDGPSRGPVRVRLDRAPGNSVPRVDLAAFVLKAAFDDTLIRKAPFVAT